MADGSFCCGHVGQIEEFFAAPREVVQEDTLSMGTSNVKIRREGDTDVSPFVKAKQRPAWQKSWPAGSKRGDPDHRDVPGFRAYS
jgi:hypothetical protein